MATKDQLRAKLRIPADQLDAINDLLLNPDARVMNDLLDVVDKYGRPEEINRKAADARQLDNLLRRLDEINCVLRRYPLADRAARQRRVRQRGRVSARRARGQGRRDDLPGRLRRHPGNQRAAVLPVADRRGEAGHRQPRADAGPLHPRAQDEGVGGRQRRHAGDRRGDADRRRILRGDAGHQGHRRARTST